MGCMSTPFQLLTKSLSTYSQQARSTWELLSFWQKTVIGGVAAYIGGISLYALYFRVSSKRKKFNAYTTSTEAINGIDLSNKVAIIIGCNTGIGKETAKIMYQQGATVIMACRNAAKAEAAKQDILRAPFLQPSPFTGKLQCMQLDLSSLQSVRDFAAAFSQKYSSLDYLVLNAGIMALPKFTTSKDGIELQFAVNHVAQQYLTQLLTPILVKNKNSSRIIPLASNAHRIVTTKAYAAMLDNTVDGPSTNDYEEWVNYSISKASNILFAREANRRLSGQGVVAVSAHPGVILESDLWRYSSGSIITAFTGVVTTSPLIYPTFYMRESKNMSQGAATTLRCVSMTNDEIQGGHYYVNCQSGTDAGLLRNAGKVRQYENYEQDSFEARLWKYTEALIKK